jgi:hypothetical protein
MMMMMNNNKNHSTHARTQGKSNSHVYVVGGVPKKQLSVDRSGPILLV